MAFRLIYDLEGAGWAMARVGNGATSIDLSVSYLRDTLRDLAEAARSLLRGGSDATVIFTDEPGEHHLVIARQGSLLTFDVRWYEDNKPNAARSFTVVLSGASSVEEFVTEVRAQLVALRRQYGLEGYKSKWVNHDFPERLLAELSESAL